MAKSDTSVRRIHTAVYAFDGCSAWVASGLVELFAVANVACRIAANPSNRAAPKVRFIQEFIGAKSGHVRASHGITLRTHPPRKRYDAVIVPPIWAEGIDHLTNRVHSLRTHSARLRKVAQRTKVLAGACTGVSLLAQAGLLDARRATTCWWSAPWFANRFPQVRLAVDRLVVRDGSLWTAAAGTAYLHLGLELVREFTSEAIATTTARLLLVEKRRGSQSPFIASTANLERSATPLLERILRELNRCAVEPDSIARVARKVGITPRTLTRRLQATLGISPLQYLQTQRVARAKQWLTESALTFEAIVENCGYRDVSSFRKLFARHVGMTPGEYRRRFGERAD